MFKTLTIGTIFLSLTLGCSQPKKQPPEALFITHITVQNFKQFQYSETSSAKPKNKKQGQGGHKGGGKGGGRGRGPDNDNMAEKPRGDNEKNLDRIRTRIEAKLSETGYCREGFMEIEHYTEAGQFNFKGECNEKATVQDHKKFKNQ